MLQKDKIKITSPSRDDMMRMIAMAWGKLDVDHTRAFKSLFVTNSLDGFDDYLASDRPFKLISDSMVSFRKMLIESEIPTSLPAVVRKLNPPKWIKRKNQDGCKLLDFSCPGDDQEDEYLNLFDNLFNSQINVEEENDGNLSESNGSSNEVLQEAATTVQHDESEIEVNHYLKSAQIRSFFWFVFSRIQTEYGDLLRI